VIALIATVRTRGGTTARGRRRRGQECRVLHRRQLTRTGAVGVAAHRHNSLSTVGRLHAGVAEGRVYRGVGAGLVDGQVR
jgi:hypothetical protein